MPRDWLSSQEAAARLGIRPQTLYAYVSRGLLESQSVPGSGRRARYPRSEVERLAARTGKGGRAGSLDVLIDTELTLVDPAGRLLYRGWDVPTAAVEASFERVAEWLWTGIDPGEPELWALPSIQARVRRVTAALPGGATPVDFLRAAALTLAAGDPMRSDRRPDTVRSVGRALITSFADVLAPAAGRPMALTLGPGRRRASSVAGRLWTGLAPRAPRPADVGCLNTALVLLADHDLAPSTLAARVTASTWADPYLVVQAGLAALGGTTHGGTANTVEQLLHSAEQHGIETVMGAAFAGSAGLPGFGHRIYTEADPRAQVLLTSLFRTPGPAKRLRLIENLLELTGQAHLPEPNIDFALGAMSYVHALRTGSGETIVAVARTAGWLAHALEEYPHQSRFRPKGVYTGPR